MGDCALIIVHYLRYAWCDFWELTPIIRFSWE